MASKYKSELLAIYRLDFYKKQKSWKLAKDIEKDAEAPKDFKSLEAPNTETSTVPPPESEKKPCLNETYNITMPEEDYEDISDLNKAFVENESEFAGNEVGWQEPSPMDYQQGDCEQYVSRESSVCLSPPSVSASEFLLGAAAAPHSSEIELTASCDSGEVPSEAVSHLSSRQLAEQVSRHAALLRDLVHEARIRADHEQRALSSLSFDHRAHSYSMGYDPPTRDHTLTPRPPHTPYTSHQDLTNPYLVGSAPPGFNPETCRDHRHKNVTTTLFDPNSQSKNDPSISFYNDPNAMGVYSDPFSECYSPPGSYSEPAMCCRDTTSVGSWDPFIAGSFKNVGEGGRGRGRLRKERVIGIGMGRPYRL